MVKETGTRNNDIGAGRNNRDENVRQHMGLIVTGHLGIVDAEVVRFLHKLKICYGQLWVMPTYCPLEPQVELGELRYILKQLSCVDHVITSWSEVPQRVPAIEFPKYFLTNSMQAVKTVIPNTDAQPKTYSIEALLNDVRPLVLLTGCFDLIHAGHIRLIEIACEHGVRPVVAALTTRGIRMQKKKGQVERPFWTMRDRITIFKELRSRPRILLFDGPNCLDLIAMIRPDVWMKELHDRGREIVDQEAELARQVGARIVWVDERRGGRSSSEIAEKILQVPYK